jgi:tryptophan-rich sensory protein
MNSNSSYLWYQKLIKPSWAPPSFLFGPVWSVLYILIAGSFGYVFYRVFFIKDIPAVVAVPFILNLVCNALFTPIQFGLKNNLLASVDILLILITLVVSLVMIYPYIRWVSYINIPYVLWVCFATTLQLTITYLNK